MDLVYRTTWYRVSFFSVTACELDLFVRCSIQLILFIFNFKFEVWKYKKTCVMKKNQQPKPKEILWSKKKTLLWNNFNVWTVWYQISLEMRVGAMCRVLPIECTYFVGHVLYLNHTAGTYCSVVFESSGGDGGLFEILTQKKKI